MNISSIDFDQANFNLSPLLATWLASEGSITIEQGETLSAFWGNILILTGLAASMVVNALMTGLIVFKIIKVFLEAKSISVERTLGSLSSTGSPKLQHIIFIIIESGMALFAIQLVRVVITSLVALQAGPAPQSLIDALYVVIPVHQTLNVITRSVHFFFPTSFVLLMTFLIGHRTHNNFGAGLDEIVL